MDREQDFGTMFEESYKGFREFNPGDVFESTIISITSSVVFIELDGKSEGQIDIEEFTDKDGQITVKSGESIRAYFVESRNGEMLFTTKLGGKRAGSDAIKSAYESGIPVEGTVSEVIKGGYNIKIGETRAFCPFSQIGLKRIDNPEELIGTKKTFKIIEYSESGRNILVSNRVLLEEEKEENISILKQELHKGLVVKCTVTSLEKFGAFVNLRGIQALLPISEISRTRVDDVSKYLTEGQEIEVKIINLDWDREKLSVSLKALIRDPWDEVDTKYRIDEKYSGTVTRVVNFGVFVALEAGLEGLIHESDFKNEVRDYGAGDNLKVGQEISVVIKSIDSRAKRISLKEVTSDKEYEENRQYFDTDSDDDTYNPFADLLKGR